MVVYPLDLVKKRLQVHNFDHGRVGFGQTEQYSGFLQCINKIVSKEGIKSLYKGTAPSLIKAAVSTGCNFCLYDQICRYHISRHISQMR